MVKRIVLKPIVWNTKKYTQPSGAERSGENFVAKYGYGHEEWNNNENWFWDGQKVFHTEATDNLLSWANDDDLGILMIASNAGKQYALGIACGVVENTSSDRKQISKDLNLFVNHMQLWKLDSVQKRFDNHDDFIAHWKKAYKWVRWRCSPDLYYWFEEPIELDPPSITGKNSLTKMFGRFQPIHPEVAWEIVDDHLPADHQIREWLSDGDFDTSTIPTSQKKPRKGPLPGKSNRPTDAAYMRYIKAMEVKVSPKHDRLQKAFVRFLKSVGAKKVREDKEYIDVQFSRDGKDFIAEVKPSEDSATKYAIRSAVGQVLEYRFAKNQSAIPLIVLSSKPSSQDEIEFVKSLGIGVCWPKTNSDRFDISLIPSWA